MPYYIRVLSTSPITASLQKIKTQLQKQRLDAKLSSAGEQDNWDRLLVTHPDDLEICEIERNPVENDGLGQEEIQEFLEEIENCRPPTAVDWLKNYLKDVKTIYAMQILFEGADHGNGWEIIGVVKEAIHGDVSGIIQADHEGFTNEDGYHILWQFSENVDGLWWMAVLKDGKWKNFQMDLGNHVHREHFWRGEMPPDAKIK